MQHIKIDSEAFKKQCQFVKDNTIHTTSTSVVREAMRVYYLQVKEDKTEELRKQLKELEK
jgi:hypothetical protein